MTYGMVSAVVVRGRRSVGPVTAGRRVNSASLVTGRLNWLHPRMVPLVVFLLLLMARVLGLVVVITGLVTLLPMLGWLVVKSHNVVIPLGQICHLHVVEYHGLAAIVWALWDQYKPLGLITSVLSCCSSFGCW